MADDRSLDEFLDTASDGDDADETDPATVADDHPDDGEDSDGDDEKPAPARSTAAFDPEGAACEACGTMVRRRWRDEGALVCDECKAW